MTKKHDFLKSEQSRDKHPERDQVGSPTRIVGAGGQSTSDPDKQVPGTGKLANDRNKMGDTEPTQVNEGRRTPDSRHDQLTLAGSHNQVSARKGGGGAGRTPRGGG